MSEEIKIRLDVHPSGEGLTLSVIYLSDGTGVSCLPVMNVEKAMHSALFLKCGYENMVGAYPARIVLTPAARKYIKMARRNILPQYAASLKSAHKNSAPTAGTVKGASTNTQGQFTANGIKTQGGAA